MSGQVDIIGLGYVGFPQAVEFGKKICALGFDIDIRSILFKYLADARL